MGCEKCETEPIRGSFYRWKNATVEIIACKEHWLEIRKVLSKAQEEFYTRRSEKCIAQ